MKYVAFSQKHFPWCVHPMEHKRFFSTKAIAKWRNAEKSKEKHRKHSDGNAKKNRKNRSITDSGGRFVGLLTRLVLFIQMENNIYYHVFDVVRRINEIMYTLHPRYHDNDFVVADGKHNGCGWYRSTPADCQRNLINQYNLCVGCGW